MSVKIQGYGPLDAKLMIVGEVPGLENERASQQLRGWMMESGIDPDSVRFENLCKYRPPGNKLSAFIEKGKPNDKLMEGLFELMEMIDLVKPNLIFGVGSNVLKFLTDKGYWNAEHRSYAGIDTWRGSIWDCKLAPGTKVVCSYHPVYLTREGMKNHGTFLADLARVKEDMEFPEFRYPVKELFPAPVGNVKQEIRERLLDSPKDSIFTIDIEYLSKKKGQRGKLICIGITNHRDWAASFPTDLPGEFEFAKELVMSGHPLNMQNSMFDASILEWHFGMAVQPFVAYDTMVAAHAANIELPKGLDYLESIYTRQPNHKDMINWEDVKAGRQPFSDVYTYNAMDVWTQHEIMEEQIKWDLNDPKVKAVFDHEMALLQPLWECSRRGVKLDLPYLDELREQMVSEISLMKGLLHSISGRPINVKSGNDMAWLLHDFLKLPITRKTKTGKPKNDDKTLAAYLVKCKVDKQVAVLDLVRDIRNRRDLLSKFINVELDEDERSRGHYDPTKTVTGRLSSKKFFPTGRGHQQQNIPRDPRIRRCFLPDEGMYFGYADLERAESLVVAHLANDPLMLEHHRPGADAHRLLAAKLFDVSEDDVTKEQRYLGKQTRHAGNYMQGPETMKQNINQKANLTGISVTYADCDRFIKLYRKLNIYLEQWWKEVERDLWASRKLFNLLGRQRIFYDHIGAIVPEAVAYVPQSTVGDVLNCGLNALHGKVTDLSRGRMLLTDAEIKDLSDTLINDWGFQMLNQVHDAVGYQAPHEHQFEVNQAIRTLLSVTLLSPKTYEEFVIPVEIANGPNWGDVKVWSEDLAAQT